MSSKAIANPFSPILNVLVGSEALSSAANHLQCVTIGLNIEVVHFYKPPPPPLYKNFAMSNHIMASTKPLTMLVTRSRPMVRLSSAVRPFTPTTSPLAVFSTTTLRAYATPSGPPPPGFRLPKPERWDESKESALDKAGKYFLLTEMARGMYVVLEQFFRPP